MNRERKRDRHGYGRTANGQVARPVTATPKKRVRPVVSGSLRMDADGVIHKGRRQFRPATWQRTGKMMLFFAPVSFLLVHFMARSSGVTVASEVGLTALYTAAGGSFLFLMEKSSYKRAQRQLGQKPRT
jgi:hypothetical protein